MSQDPNAKVGIDASEVGANAAETGERDLSHHDSTSWTTTRSSTSRWTSTSSPSRGTSPPRSTPTPSRSSRSTT